MMPGPDTHSPQLRPKSIPSRHAFIATGIVALLILGLDQIVKNLIAQNYQPNHLIFGTPYISLVYVTNTGGICGYAQGSNTILILIGTLTVVTIVASILFFMPKQWPYSAAFGLLLAGALGNLVDRLRFGHVIDYITFDFLGWPSFNIADTSILAGIGILALLTAQELLQEHQGEVEPLSSLLDRKTILFIIIAGLLLVLAYILCIYRPFD